ncbi:MAG TPA: hypothetical protein VF788_12735 [Pseudonocardiaceae bacterium]|jgi:hypothetical protein
MLVDDARRIAAAIEERLNAGASQGLKATVRADENRPTSVPAGAGRPTFISYFIEIADGTRMASLTLGQAAGLLEDVKPDWDPDRLFDAIRAMDVSVEETP